VALSFIAGLLCLPSVSKLIDGHGHICFLQWAVENAVHITCVFCTCHATCRAVHRA
jgi:hypothetical protein